MINYITFVILRTLNVGTNVYQSTLFLGCLLEPFTPSETTKVFTLYFFSTCKTYKINPNTPNASILNTGLVIKIGKNRSY